MKKLISLLKHNVFVQFAVLLLFGTALALVINLVPHSLFSLFPSEPKDSSQLKTIDSLKFQLIDAKKQLSLANDTIRFSREKIQIISAKDEEDKRQSNWLLYTVKSDLKFIKDDIQNLLLQDTDTLDSELLLELGYEPELLEEE